MQHFNAQGPSWLGHAMEPNLNSGQRAFPVKHAEAACYARNHRPYSILKSPGVSLRCGAVGLQGTKSCKCFLDTNALRQ